MSPSIPTSAFSRGSRSGSAPRGTATTAHVSPAATITALARAALATALALGRLATALALGALALTGGPARAQSKLATQADRLLAAGRVAAA